RFAQIELRRKPLDRAADDAGCVLGIDLAIDREAEGAELAAGGKDMYHVAEGILPRPQHAALVEIDAPAPDILAVMVARRQAQHRLGRPVVAVGGFVMDPDAHVRESDQVLRTYSRSKAVIVGDELGDEFVQPGLEDLLDLGGGELPVDRARGPLRRTRAVIGA